MKIKGHAAKGLAYDDVLLVPQYSDIRSRSEVSIASALDGPYAYVPLRLPIIASPMDTISEEEMGVAMWQEGGLAVVHRYNTIDRQIEILDHIIVLCQANAAVFSCKRCSAFFRSFLRLLVSTLRIFLIYL